MKIKEIMTILALSLTTIVSVGCMEKEAISTGDIIEIATETGMTTEASVSTETSTTTGTSTTTETSTSTETSTTDTTTSTTTKTSNSTSAGAVKTETTTVIASSSLNTAEKNVSTNNTKRIVNENTTKKESSTRTETTYPVIEIKLTSKNEPEKVKTFFNDENQFLESEYKETNSMSSQSETILTTTNEVVDALINDLNSLSTTATTKKEKSSSISANYLGEFRITGYYGDRTTASGKKPISNHTVAMNNAQRKGLGIDYGDIIYIDGDKVKGYYTVEDRGCGYDVIDIYCDNRNECYQITSYADIYSNVIINEN